MDTPISIVILAAGLGTRMKSAKAKVLHSAGGRTLVEHVVHTAREAAPESRLVVVVGHQAGEVEAALSGCPVTFALQSEQKGTGHAVMACRGLLESRDGLVVILYGDCPLLSPETLRALITRHNRSADAVTVVTTLLDDPSGYGRIVAGETGRIHAIVEQKAASPAQLAIREINSGIYCFRAAPLWRHLDEIKTTNPAGEFYLTDMVEILGRHGYTAGAFRLDDPTEVLGINTRVELAEVDRILRARTARRLMLAGVTIEKPETVTIDAGVAIGMDTVIEPFAQILGNTAIGSNCRIGACSIVKDSRLGDGVSVFPFSIVGTSILEAGVEVGPYARLRMENHVEAGAHVGNFVELKKTRLGSDAKAMHLAYLGDSVIGSKVNVGAGTITCNYDGVKKHQTRIGDGAFVGSNSTLVAPVEIGPGSYVAAGSVITETVPADSLALGRSRQSVKEGWAARRRQRASGK